MGLEKDLKSPPDLAQYRALQAWQFFMWNHIRAIQDNQEDNYAFFLSYHY